VPAASDYLMGADGLHVHLRAVAILLTAPERFDYARNEGRRF
jgi:hypothetical protein